MSPSLKQLQAECVTNSKDSFMTSGERAAYQYCARELKPHIEREAATLARLEALANEWLQFYSQGHPEPVHLDFEYQVDKLRGISKAFADRLLAALNEGSDTK